MFGKRMSFVHLAARKRCIALVPRLRFRFATRSSTNDCLPTSACVVIMDV